MKAGIGYLPEDRQKEGLILDWGLGQNVTLSTLEKFTKFTVINRKAERERSKELLEKVKTKALSVFDKASSLSGGNQQKVIVAKVLHSDLKVVILDEPTKGVDVGAKAQIYEIMSELAAQGFGVIMISSEMPEVLGMADTILVMKEGRVSKIFADATGVTQEQILEAAMNRRCNLIMKLKKFFSSNIREISLIIVMIALSVFIEIRSGGNFFTLENISDMFTETAVLAITAVGMMMVIITSGIDLSIGSIMALGAMVGGTILKNNQAVPGVVIILVSIAVGIVCGFINGTLVAN